MENSYREALAWLEERQETRWELGLGRVRALLERLGSPHSRVPAVHVAGTNGKGSFCALLAGVLSQAGLRAGLYTSPHLNEPTERINIDGTPVDEKDFARLLSEVRRAETEPATYFELLTAAAFLHFQQAGAQAAVVEVGLGGRLDATNALEKPLLTVITSIDFDHTQHLGSTLAAIAREKAGILKPGVPCLIGGLPPEALSVVHARAREIGAPILPSAPRLEEKTTHWESGVQELRDAGGRMRSLRLLGKAAARNAALVLVAAEHLRGRGYPLAEDAVDRAFLGAEWPCRFQTLRLEDGRDLVLDGAHNPAAMSAFLDTWGTSPFSSRAGAAFIVGMLRDKDWRAMADMLGRRAREIIVTKPDSPRALEPAELARALKPYGCSVSVQSSPEEAFECWQRSDSRAAAVCGSFYLAGKIWGLTRKGAAAGNRGRAADRALPRGSAASGGSWGAAV